MASMTKFPEDPTRTNDGGYISASKPTNVIPPHTVRGMDAITSSNRSEYSQQARFMFHSRSRFSFTRSKYRSV